MCAFKEFGGVDAIPICLDSKDVDEIVDVVIKLAPAFGGFNLEDISSPRCFEIERRLKESLDIPVFHDDQHGTAVVVLAALINAFQLVGKNFSDVEIVINGAERQESVQLDCSMHTGLIILFFVINTAQFTVDVKWE